MLTGTAGRAGTGAERDERAELARLRKENAEPHTPPASVLGPRHAARGRAAGTPHRGQLAGRGMRLHPLPGVEMPVRPSALPVLHLPQGSRP
jgi:hypothetical protein